MKKKQLLFVDDEVRILNALKRMLRSFEDDWHMEFVSSVDEALEKIQTTTYDIVLSDMKMPDKTGIDLLTSLSEAENTRTLPVIILTGLQDVELKRQALDLGAIDLLNKPVQLEDLLARINSVLKLKAYQDELIEKNHELEEQLIQKQKMEVIGKLAAGAFHDINNILAIIGGYSQLAKMNPKLIGKSMVQINQSCHLASQFIQQILEFSKSKKEEKTLGDLGAVVTQALELLNHCLPKRIEVKWEQPSGLPQIATNSTQIFQLMMNLCLNASHAIIERGVIQVSLTHEIVAEGDRVTVSDDNIEPGEYMRLSISDSGSGMGDQTLNNLFTPFFSKKWSYGGTGLGMAVVQRIIKSHDGRIVVDSLPGQGTEISIYFPLAQQEEAPADAVSQEEPAGKAAQPIEEQAEAPA